MATTRVVRAVPGLIIAGGAAFHSDPTVAVGGVLSAAEPLLQAWRERHEDGCDIRMRPFYFSSYPQRLSLSAGRSERGCSIGPTN
jgi:hypothetical protein